jgi:sodium/bile acid cotransporter 7
VLFGSGAGLAVLPLMLFHQMQLMVCAVIAKRWARNAEAGPEETGLRSPGDSAGGAADGPADERFRAGGVAAAGGGGQR